MSDVVTTLVTALEKLGLNKYAIAGILGNLTVESGLSTTSLNSREGAIGIAQWEGGRRTALQQFAAANGGSETDPQIQVEFLLHELQGGYSGVLSQLRTATSAEQAATIWDSQYEVSAGTTRSQRIAAANTWLDHGFSAATLSAAQQVAGATPASSESAGSTQLSSPTLGDYQGVDSLGALLSKVPELQTLVKQATAGSWSLSKFENAVEDSAWWKQHSQTARSVLIEQANDPATFSQDLRNAELTVTQLAKSLGFSVNSTVANAIATSAMLTGNGSNQQWLTLQLGKRENYSSLTDVQAGSLGGQMAQTYQQLSSMAADYGLTFSPRSLAQAAQQIVMGNQTADYYKQHYTALAKSAFPSIAKLLDEGQTVRQVADPYVSSMSQLLEVDPSSLNVMSTPLIKKALQGTTGQAGEPPTLMPLWQFENQVRNDPRWQYTQNAKDTASSALVKIGSDFGFAV